MSIIFIILAQGSFVFLLHGLDFQGVFQGRETTYLEKAY